MPPLVDRRKYKGIQVRKDRLLPRAGGLFRPDSSTEPILAYLNSEQKGCLRYKIYQHNRRYRILFKVDWLLGPNGY